jgi:hypothetical protein
MSLALMLASASMSQGSQRIHLEAQMINDASAIEEWPMRERNSPPHSLFMIASWLVT